MRRTLHTTIASVALLALLAFACENARSLGPMGRQADEIGTSDCEPCDPATYDGPGECVLAPDYCESTYVIAD